MLDSAGSECGPSVVSFENNNETPLLVKTAEFFVQLHKQDGTLCPLESELTLHEDQFEQH